MDWKDISTYKKTLIIVLVIGGTLLICGGVYLNHFDLVSKGQSTARYYYGWYKGSVTGDGLYLVGGAFWIYALYMIFFQNEKN